MQRIPKYALVYHVLDEQEEIDKIILPIEGYGLWSTLYGYLALESDTRTIAGITFYEHGETPGLGGEVGCDLPEVIVGPGAFSPDVLLEHSADPGRAGVVGGDGQVPGPESVVEGL